MAIQFNCPYCTAAIRVGDEAAGKIGKCPKCETKLRVPSPVMDAGKQDDESPARDAGIIPGPDETAPANFEPIAPSLDVSDVADGSAAIGPVINTTRSPAPSYAAQVRQKRGGGWWIGPVLFGGLLLAAAAGYWWFTRETMTGELVGTPIPVDKAVTAYIGPASVDMPRAEFMESIESLRTNPVLIESTVLRVELRGSRLGLQVTLQAGSETELVAAQVGRQPAVSAFVAEHAMALSQPLAQELRTEATGFIRNWQEAQSAGMELGNLSAYRDVVGTNALLGGLGYHSEAIVEGTAYPCVHEDNDGALYFVVPRGTEVFFIRARSFEGRESVLTGPYEFTVRVDRGTSASQPEPPTDSPATEDSSDAGRAVGEQSAEAPTNDDPDESSTVEE